MITEINKEIDNLITDDRIGESLDLLQDLIEFNTDLSEEWKSQILVLSNNLNSLNNESIKNIVDSKDSAVRKNIIINSILKLKRNFFRQLNRYPIKIPSYILDRINAPIPEMIEIKGGSFRMGSNEGIVDESPSHLVTVDSFSIGKFPVTNSQFILFLNSHEIKDTSRIITLNQERTLTSIESPIIEKNKQFICQSEVKLNPVIYVSWFGAKEYCNWLSFTTNESYRLPNEAEWEYAAKGGSKSKKNKFSGSNNINNVAWYEKNNLGSPSTCGQKNPNEIGLFDMSGNIWEWCEDWYDDKYYQLCHEKGIVKNPRGPIKGSFRNLRGGAWNSIEFDCRINSRGAHFPSKKEDYYGFRILKE